MLSLPKSRGNLLTSKNIYEEAQARRRNLEEANFNKWQNAKEYFNSTAVRAAKEKQWSSDNSFLGSAEAFQVQSGENAINESLILRRGKLRKLLSDDAEKHKVLLEAYANKSKDKSAMLVRSTALKQARDLENAKLAETLLAQHFKINSPDYRNLARDADLKKTVESWNVQNAERITKENQNKLDELTENEIIEETKLREQELEQQAELKRLEARQRQLECLKQQLDEVHNREAKANELSRQEQALINQLAKLDSLEKERRNIEEKCKRELYGRSLLRQHHAAIRRRAGLIQAELEADKNWLARLAEEEVAESQANQQKKLQEQKNIIAMKQLVEEDLRREKAKEIELEAMDAYEASKAWAQREEQWRREAEARQNLLRQVIEERRAQITDRLVANQNRQRDELVAREALLEALERNKEESFEYAQEKQEATLQRRQDLDQQVEEKMEALTMRKAEMEAEQNATREAETAYETMLRQEAEKLKNQDLDPDFNDNKSLGKVSSRSRSGRKLW